MKIIPLTKLINNNNIEILMIDYLNDIMNIYDLFFPTIVSIGTILNNRIIFNHSNVYAHTKESSSNEVQISRNDYNNVCLNDNNILHILLFNYNNIIVSANINFNRININSSLGLSISYISSQLQVHITNVIPKFSGQSYIIHLLVDKKGISDV